MKIDGGCVFWLFVQCRMTESSSETLRLECPGRFRAYAMRVGCLAWQPVNPISTQDVRMIALTHNMNGEVIQLVSVLFLHRKNASYVNALPLGYFGHGGSSVGIWKRAISFSWVTDDSVSVSSQL